LPSPLNATETVLLDTDVVESVIAGAASVSVEPITAYGEQPAAQALTKK